MDLFEKYLQDAANLPALGSSGVAPQEIAHPELPRVGENEAQSIIKAGMKVNHFRVIERAMRQGQHGQYSNREYVVECECGTRLRASYHQLYYGTAYSCGCIKRVKHPPVKLEGERVGRVEVLRWTDAGWEIVCHECGALMYRKTVYQVRAAGKTCDSHNIETP